MRLVSLLVLLTACAAKESDTGAGPSDPGASSANGFIFKGPMDQGATITFQPVDESLQAIGEPTTLSVEDWGGAYAGALPFSGPAEIIATGTAFNEAEGARKEAETVTLRAWANLSGEATVQVNLLTDLTHQRVATHVAAGLSLEEAITTAEAEFHEALGWSRRGPVEEAGSAIDPYGDTYDQSWVFAVSSIVAQAGRDFGRPDGDSTNGDMLALGALMDDLRAGFGATGALTDITKSVLRVAEERTDPDLAVLGLTAHMEDYDLGYSLPDLHPALDSDHDGVVNSEDNCRYVSNEDQSPLDGYRFGAACDQRLLDISTTEEWGCAVLGAGGALSCWGVESSTTGGTPPRPDVFPSAAGASWPDGTFPGVYNEIELDSTGEAAALGHLACARSTAGAVTCWRGDAPLEPFVLADSLSHLRLSGGAICGLLASGDAVCTNRDGTNRRQITGPFTDLDVRADNGLCALSAESGLASCYDSAGAPLSVDLPAVALRAIATNDALGQEFGCGLAAYDGSVLCWGDAPFAPPAGTGFVSLSVGRFRVCAADAAGALTCSSDEEACPATDDSPPALLGLTSDLCVTCGLDPEGLGACWPRYWNRRRAEEGGAP